MKTDAEMQQWLHERNKAFRTLDLVWARKQVNYLTDETQLMALHKARYECKAIEPEYRHTSREWLQSRGFGRTFNQPWPAEGVLEE